MLAVGFRESGDEGALLEARLLYAARRHGVRVVGPNTSGILNLPLGLNLIGARGVRPGSISLLVQSGNMALALMNEVTARSEEGIAVAVGVGNELDLGFHEYLDFLGRHEETRAVVCYVEGFRDARAFLQVAAKVSRTKPVIVLKGARSASGRAAARSHTGSVSGEYDRLGRAPAGRGRGDDPHRRAAPRRGDARLPAAHPALRRGAGHPLRRGRAGDAGGRRALRAGRAAGPLGASTRSGSAGCSDGPRPVANPVDLAGASDADPEVFGRALQVLAEDRRSGASWWWGSSAATGSASPRSSPRPRCAPPTRWPMSCAGTAKPLVVHSMYAAHRSEPLRTLGRGHVPVVESLDVAARCAAETWRRGRLLRRRPWSPEHAPDAGVPGAGRRVRDLDVPEALARARGQGRDALTEPEARALLRGCGLALAPASLCVTPEEAARAVAAMGSAAVVKVVSAKIPHKTDAGGVVLGVTTAEGASAAFLDIEERSARWLEAKGLEPGVEGVLVTPMLAAPLAELLVGAHRDPELGPVLTLGAGGIWVEVLRDVAHRVLPVDADEVRQMVG